MKTTHWILMFVIVIGTPVVALTESATGEYRGKISDTDRIALTFAVGSSAGSETFVVGDDSRVVSSSASFRTIQGHLLGTALLRQDAVTVRVSDGMVTLEGSVASAAARESAVQIARSSGVSAVRDLLEVESDEAS